MSAISGGTPTNIATSPSEIVNPGAPTTIRVETAANGTGAVVPAQTVASGNAVVGYSVTRDAWNNFVANVAATWSLASGAGGVVAGDLVASADGKSAAFTGHVIGTAQLRATSGTLTATNSGTLTVAAGTATSIRVETAANGSGVVLPAQTLTSGTAVTGYAVARDASNNFVANTAATWSLASTSGGVVPGDLVASADTKSATFTGHGIGTAQTRATSGALSATNSGTLTVSPGPAAVIIFTAQPTTGTANVAFTPQPVVAIRDAFGNAVTSGPDATAIVSLALVSGSGALIGTTSMAAVAGIADFAGKGVGITLGGSGKQLRATKADMTGAGGVGPLSVNGNSFTIAARTTSTSITCAPNPIAVLGSTTCTATVTDTAGVGATTPTGSVTFATDGSGTFTPQSTCVLSGASCAVTYVPTARGSGTHAVGSSYAGDGAHATSTATAFALTVDRVTPVITWSNPADINSGTPLGAAQLNATADVAGTFMYTPASGTVLNAGPGQTLHTQFTPTDSADYNGASKDVTINVINAGPTVTLTSPASGSTFAAPAAIALAADAHDSDGTVTQVDFYAGATLIGTQATPPYNLAWNNVPAGIYALTAVATDNLGATTTSSTVPITVNAFPVITSVSPGTGVVGTIVTITGTDFGATQGSSTVRFNGVIATPATWSATTITAPVPTGATTGDVVVTVNSQASNGIPFVIGPVITSLTPASGTVGTPLTIAGSGFGANQGASSITFSGRPAVASAWSDTNIASRVPGSAIRFGTMNDLLRRTTGLPDSTRDFTIFMQAQELAPALDNNDPAGNTWKTAFSLFTGGLEDYSTPYLGVFYYDDGAGHQIVTGEVPIGDTDYVPAGLGSWHWVALTYNAATHAVTFYADGVPSGSLTFDYSSTPFTSLVLGEDNIGRPGVAGAHYREWQGLLTPAELVAEGVSASAVRTADLVTDTALVVPADLADKSGHGHDWTAVGSPLTTTGPPLRSALSFASQNDGVTRNGTFLDPAQDWTFSTFAQFPILPPSEVSVRILGPGDQSGPANIGIYTSTDGPNVVLYGYVTPDGVAGGSVGAGQPITVGTWYHSAIRYKAETHEVSFVVNGIELGSDIIDLSGVARQVNEQLGPAGTGDLGNVAVAYARSWQAWLSDTELASEMAVPRAVRTANLLSDTPLIGPDALNDFSGNGHGWTAVGAPSTTAGPDFGVSGPVVVTVNGIASNAFPFDVVPPATITSVTPTSGAPGAAITIAGTNFGASQGDSLLTFNGVAATPSSWSDTSIVAAVPATATSGSVVVTIGVIPSNAVPFTVVPAPHITSVSPSSGSVGATVTIAGSNFGNTQDASTVTFNGVAATPTAWSSTSIIVTVPPAAATGPVIVTVSGGASNAVTFTLPPQITSVSPTSGPIGAIVTIAGSNFGAAQSGNGVTFSGVPATVTTWGQASIVARVPATAVSGDVVVTVNGIASNAVAFAVAAAPVVTAVSPATGVVGRVVTITGANFTATPNGNSVAFNGVAATPISWTATRIVTSVPAGATSGPVAVVVSGVSAAGPVFTVITSGSLVGTVTRASDGGGVSGAQIAVLQGASVIAQATTVGTGQYTVGSLTAGSYDVRTTAAGLPTTTQTGIAIIAGQTTTDNIVLGALGRITGRVMRADSGAAIAGAAITAAGGTPGAATSDASGAYTIWNLAAGGYSLTVSADGYKSATAAASVSDGAATSSNFALQTGVVSYVYDDLNRLVGVVDPSGASAAYRYDAVGNILSITRQSADATSILGLAPSRGPIGTTVVMTGTAFGSTPGSNTVAFNGVIATVTAASTTQVTAIVPAGASTGPVTVTTPTGTAASPGPFIVTSTTGVPTITGFSPAIAAPGAVLSISGSNFDPLVANDRVRVNASLTQVTGATATTISANIPPAATSGHVSLSTPAGTVVTPDVLFVAPAPYSASDVAFTGVATFDQGLEVALGDPTHVSLVVFDGTAQQRIFVAVHSSSFVYRSLIGPTGAYDFSFITSGGEATLPVTGTYTLILGRSDWDALGSATVTVSNAPSDLSAGTITIDGPPVAVTIPTVNQRARLTFVGQAGQHVSVTMVDSTVRADVSLLTPTGIQILGDEDTFNPQEMRGGDSRDAVLPMAGLYTILIDPRGTGTATLALTTVPADVTGTIDIDGPPMTVTIPTPGQNARVTFDGTADQHVVLLVTDDTLYTLNAIVAPDGTVLDWVNFGTTLGTLPQTGTYTIVIDPSVDWTGSETLQLIEAPPDTVGSIEVDGDPVTISVTAPWQNARLIFSGNAGDHIALSSTNSTFEQGALLMLDPDNNIVVDAGIGVAFVDRVLPATGAYALIVNGYGVTGDVTIQLSTVPADVTANITIGGPPVTVTTSSPGQGARVTFSAVAGQRVSLGLAPDASPLYFSTIELPSGYTYVAYGGNLIEFYTAYPFDGPSGVLTETGVYTLVFRPTYGSFGSRTLTLYDVPPDVTTPITPGGSPVTVTLTTPGQHGRLPFDGIAGHRVSVATSNGTFPNGKLAVGVLSTSNSNMGQSGFIDAVTLSQTGTVIVRVDSYTASTGSVSVRLYDASDVTAGLTIGDAPLAATIGSPGQNALFTFQATAGQSLTAQFTGNTIPSATISLVDPHGTALRVGSMNGSTFTLPSVVASTTGTYWIRVNPAGTSTGSFSIKVTSP